MTVPRLQNLAPGGAAGAAMEVGSKEGARARTTTLGDNGRRRVIETRGSSRCTRPLSRLGAPESLGKASRVAGGPSHRPLKGHVARADRCRRAPRKGRAARGWPRAGLRGAGPDPDGSRRGPILP